MGPEDFRRVALSMPEAVEVYRRGVSHFRLERKTFASLEGPGGSTATINLTPDQQSMFMRAAPKAFGLGSTHVLLASVAKASLESAIGAAWQNVAPKSLLKRIDEQPINTKSTPPVRAVSRTCFKRLA